MAASDLIRSYVLLKPVRSGCTGFARLECQHGRGRVYIQTQGLPTGCGCVRALLVSGDAGSGSVMDLGLMHLRKGGCGLLRRDSLVFPTRQGYRAYHTLLLSADWPEPSLLLTGVLDAAATLPLWQLRELLSHYLSVPSPEDPPQPPAEEAQPSPCPAPPACPVTLPVEEAPQPAALPTVQCLPPVIWPEAIAELKVYFDTLPPFAPFDAPGWRFVRVPLPGRMPAPYCAVGIRVTGREVSQVAYALPGLPGTLPPGGLRGYRWQAGRNGQGYWTLWQRMPPVSVG